MHRSAAMLWAETHLPEMQATWPALHLSDEKENDYDHSSNISSNTSTSTSTSSSTSSSTRRNHHYRYPPLLSNIWLV
jgi:hypothetical protein